MRLKNKSSKYITHKTCSLLITKRRKVNKKKSLVDSNQKLAQALLVSTHLQVMQNQLKSKNQTLKRNICLLIGMGEIFEVT